MYQRCSYHIIDSLIPPTSDVDIEIRDSLLRLESLSACVIVKYNYKCEILSNIPRKLHQVIWKAYLRQEYYSHNDRLRSPALNDLPKLLNYWPDEEFILKELMPNFPSKLCWFSKFLDDLEERPLRKNERYLKMFYHNVVDSILNFCNTNLNEFRIRKLDISGFWPIDKDNLLLRIIPLTGLFGNGMDKFEVIIDTELRSYQCGKDYANSSNPIVMYGHLSLSGDHCVQTAMQVIEESLNKELKSLQISMDIDITKFMKDVFETTHDQNNILSIGFLTKVNSLTFLEYFNHLEHLDLFNSNLHGKLDPLLHMEKGLRFLNLDNCCLDNSDLDVLLKSCHTSSLLELNLSLNKFGENCTNLIRLCRELSNVIKLELCYCHLDALNNNDLIFLCDSINHLQNLSHLNLSCNEFSMDTIISHLSSLSLSSSLRLLELKMPTRNLWGNKKKKMLKIKLRSFQINTQMNKDRSQLLYVDFGGVSLR